MPTLEERVAFLEAADTVTRRQLTELTALTGTSFLNVHHEFDRLHEQTSALNVEVAGIKTEMSGMRAEFRGHLEPLENDVAAILKILNDQYRRS